MAYIIVASGPHNGQSFKLDKCPLSAGREVMRDIQIVDPKVSRKHFTIDRDARAGATDDGNGDGYRIVPQSGKNGVHVNGNRIDGPHRLSNGDHVRVGDTELVFVANEPARIDAFKRFREFSAASRAATVEIGSGNN